MTDKVSSKIARHQPTSDYDDAEIFGSKASQLMHHLKAGNDSECVLYGVGTFASKEKWGLKDLTGVDKRLCDMMQGLKINHAFPIQRFSWPKIHSSNFANLIISPEATGKTYAHLLYVVSRCIQSNPIPISNNLLNGDDRHQFVPKDTMDLDKLIIHPKFIVICSSQDQAEMIKRTIELMKEKAYGIGATDARRDRMPPISRTVNIHQDDTKLALRCNESDLLVGTPPTILKCLKMGLIHFAKCEKVFFDDLDVVLQLQNSNVRELIKIYLRQIEFTLTITEGAESAAKKACRINLFSRKWTDLVRQFMGSVFTQKNLLFGSLAEASICNNLKFEVECYNDFEGLCKTISHLISRHLEISGRERIGVISRTDEEASRIAQALTDKGHAVKMLREDTSDIQPRGQLRTRSARDLVFIISDPALQFEVELSCRRKPLDDIVHIIHATLPNDMLVIDQRFRLSYKHIQDKKNGLTSTILLGKHLDVKLAKQLYDLMSRSSATQTASRLLVRDLICNMSTDFCWRWATTGLCRLEKLSRDDRFGSYCSDRHSFGKDIARADNRWPEFGLVRMTITHIVSPSEFYFWFEGYRESADGRWVKCEKSGINFMWKLQQQLDELKSTDIRSVPLDKVSKGKVYGVYFPQELRVDRVCLLDEPKRATDGNVVNAALEYSKRVPVVKIDYGSRVEVYVKNLIELPENLANCPAQCHRALILGYRPTDNEPNWLYKTKRRFYELVTASDCCELNAWLRTNRNDCFWFENLVVSRKLSNIDSSDVCYSQPHRELLREKLAEVATSEPPGLKPSTRLETMGKWNNDKLEAVAQQAFMDRDLGGTPRVFVFDVWANFTMLARRSSFDKQLVALERRISEEIKADKLPKQSYLAEGAYCIARIPLGKGHTFSRAKITKITQDFEMESHTSSEKLFRVRCLDHGDYFDLTSGDLFQASAEHIRLLPFQAICCKLANISDELLTDSLLNRRARESIIDLTRVESGDYKPVRCRCDADGHWYLYVKSDQAGVYEPLSSLLLKSGIRLHAQPEPAYESSLRVEDEERDTRSVGLDTKMCQYIVDLLRDIVKEELKSFGVDTD